MNKKYMILLSGLLIGMVVKPFGLGLNFADAVQRNTEFGGV